MFACVMVLWWISDCVFWCRCVVVLLNPRKNKQQHIINTSRWVLSNAGQCAFTSNCQNSARQAEPFHHIGLLFTGSRSRLCPSPPTAGTWSQERWVSSLLCLSYLCPHLMHRRVLFAFGVWCNFAYLILIYSIYLPPEICPAKHILLVRTAKPDNCVIVPKILLFQGKRTGERCSTRLSLKINKKIAIYWF